MASFSCRARLSHPRNIAHASHHLEGLVQLLAKKANRLDASSYLVRQSLELFDDAGVPWGEPYHYVNLLLQGRDEEARPLVDGYFVERLGHLKSTAWAGVDIGYWLSNKAWLGDCDILEQIPKVPALDLVSPNQPACVR